MTQTLELTATQLCQSIRDEWGSRRQDIPWDENDSRWTEWVKSTFHHIGERQLEAYGKKGTHWDVESTKLPDGRGQGEYLVDVCWWTEREGRYRLELAVESEWNPHKSEIEQDFYKLIDVKSRLKVWVCSYESQLKSRLSDMGKAIRSAQIRNQDEEYLILNLPETQTPNVTLSFVVQPFLFDWQGRLTKLPKFTVKREQVEVQG